jgi:tetratricopeptide (TPR) repeat protein
VVNIVDDFKQMLGENLPEQEWKKGFKLLIQDITTNDWSVKSEFKKLFPHYFSWSNSTAKKNLEEAEQYLRTAVEKDPDYAPAWRSLGNYYQDLKKDVKEAQKCYDRAANIRE